MAGNQKLPPLRQTFSMVFVILWIAVFTYPGIWQLTTSSNLFHRYDIWYKINKSAEDKIYPFVDLLHLIVYPVHNAALKGEPKRISKLAPSLDKLNSPDYFDLTPLAYAAMNSDLPMLKSFLEAGVDPDVRLFKKNTALHLAASYGREEAYLLLLNHKARPDLQGEDGLTPIHLCIKNNLTTAFMASLQTNFDLDQPDNNKLTPLDYAIQKNSFEMVTALARAGAQPIYSKSSSNFQISLFLAQWQKTGNYKESYEFVLQNPKNFSHSGAKNALPAEFPVDNKPVPFSKKTGVIKPDENL